MLRNFLLVLTLGVALSACFHRPEIKTVTMTEGIEISLPAPNVAVGSPLSVSGRARGYWFFEGSLPILLVDEEGGVIKSSYGTADGEWMTEDYVPFHTDIEFETDAKSGYLIVRKDNPSGLPENEAEVKVPVRFE